MRAPRYSLAAALGLVHLIRLHLLTFGIGLFMLAASLQWEPEQWRNPVFGIVFVWLRPSQWAILLSLIAFAKLVACIIYPAGVPLALVLGNMLFAAWTVSFIFAYFDPNTMPASPLLPMLGAFVVGEHIAVASLLEREKQISPDGQAHK